MLIRHAFALLIVSAVAYSQVRGPATSPRQTTTNPSRQWATQTEAMAYSEAFIDSLSWAKSGRSRLTSDDPLGKLTVTLFQLKQANLDYEKAAIAVRQFSKSTTKTIQISAEGTEL